MMNRTAARFLVCVGVGAGALVGLAVFNLKLYLFTMVGVFACVALYIIVSAVFGPKEPF